jgi:glutamyl endopeptidase
LLEKPFEDARKDLLGLLSGTSKQETQGVEEMTVASSRAAWMRLTTALVLFAALCIATTSVQTTRADGPTNGENIIVSSLGKEYAAPPADSTFSASFKGTGKLAGSVERSALRTGSVIRERGESIIGPDSRRQVTNTTKFPNRAIASMVMRFDGIEYACTAWFIGPHTLATAGHCVYDPALQEFATDVVIYPARDGNTMPFGSAVGVELFTNKCWKDSTGFGNPKCDYGAVKINKELGNTVGWFGYFSQPNPSDVLNRKINIRGYPGDKLPFGNMWTMKGPIQQATNKMLGYSIDTGAGQSGAPMFHKVSGCGKCSYGIHAYAVGVPPFTDRNSGLRINQKVYNNLTSWKTQ